MRMARIAVYWFIAGSLVFLLWADYTRPLWNNAYFTWDAARDLLFVLAVFDLIPRANRWFLKPVIVYCSIRLLWEIINMATGIGTGEQAEKVSSIGFLVLATGVALLLLKDLVNRWNRNSSY